MSNNKHNHTQEGWVSPTYVSWRNMRARCENPNHDSYHAYGGRGITVCDRWLKFENFLEDMGERPDGMTIDRLDSERNYDPVNCKWSTYAEQTWNRSNSVITFEDAVTISKRLIKQEGDRREIGDAFKVSSAFVGRIARRERWEPAFEQACYDLAQELKLNASTNCS